MQCRQCHPEDGPCFSCRDEARVLAEVEQEKEAKKTLQRRRAAARRRERELALRDLGLTKAKGETTTLAKFTAVLHVSLSSECDGTSQYASLHQVLDASGQPVSVKFLDLLHKNLDFEPEQGEWLVSDNPVVYGNNKEYVTLCGRQVKVETLLSSADCTDDPDVNRFDLEFEADPKTGKLVTQAELVYAHLETNPHNDNGVALFGYFRGKPTLKQVKELFKSRLQLVKDKKLCTASLGWLKPELTLKPSPLSKATGLTRAYLGQCG